MSAKTSGSPSRTGSVREPVQQRRKKLYDYKNQIKSVSVKLALIVIVVVLILVIISNQTALSCMNINQCVVNAPALIGNGGNYPVMISGSRIYQTDTISGNLAVLTDTSFQVYNRSAKLAASRSHFLSRPVMKTDGYYAILIDVGGTGFRFEGITDSIVTGNYDHNLISCAVSESARFALVAQGASLNSSMLSSVDVIDANGHSLHLWETPDYYINDAALSSNGKKVAMCGINARSGYMRSVVTVHTVGEGEITHFNFPDIMLYSVYFTENEGIVAIGDSGIYIIPNTYVDSDIKHYVFTGQLLAYDFDKDYGAAVYTSEFSGSDSGVLTLYDTTGEERFSKTLSLNAADVSVSSSGCCILGSGELQCYRLNGGLVGRWQTDTTPSSVVMILRGAYLADGVNITYQELVSQKQEE